MSGNFFFYSIHPVHVNSLMKGQQNIYRSVGFPNKMCSLEYRRLVQYAEYAVCSYRITKFQHIKTHIFKHEILKFLFRYWFIIIYQRKWKKKKLRRHYFSRPVFHKAAILHGQTLNSSLMSMKKKNNKDLTTIRASHIHCTVSIHVFTFSPGICLFIIIFEKKVIFSLEFPVHMDTITTNCIVYSISNILQCGFGRHILKLQQILIVKLFNIKV